MSDEAGFLRAIHQSPADDAPRLVYADWLDERNDPRGRFLRDECLAAAAFRAGDPGPARKLREGAGAIGLDWALSVARPPVGVCAPLGLTDSGKPVTADRLDAAAKRAGVTLPPDYRAFLLLHNGGRPRLREFTAADVGETTVEEFRPFRPTEGFVTVLEMLRGGLEDDQPEEPYAKLLPVAVPGMSEDRLAVSCAPDQLGAVFYIRCVEGVGDPEPIAGSFAEFLAMLADSRPEGIRLAEENDVAGMARWLDAGGDPFAKDPKTGSTVMDKVVTGNKVKLLKLILARKPKFPPAAEERVRKQIKLPFYKRYVEIQKLIEGYLGPEAA